VYQVLVGSCRKWMLVDGIPLLESQESHHEGSVLMM
jgi:hypothetical protein